MVWQRRHTHRYTHTYIYVYIYIDMHIYRTYHGVDVGFSGGVNIDGLSTNAPYNWSGCLWRINGAKDDGKAYMESEEGNQRLTTSWWTSGARSRPLEDGVMIMVGGV